MRDCQKLVKGWLHILHWKASQWHWEFGQKEKKNRHWNISGPTPSFLTFWSAASHSTRSAEICPDTILMLLHLKVSQVSTFNWTLSLLQAKHHPHLDIILTSQSILWHFFFSSPSYSSTTLSVFSAPPSSAFWCKISFLLGRAPARQIQVGDWIQAGDWMTLPTINRSDFHSHSLAGLLLRASTTLPFVDVTFSCFLLFYICVSSVFGAVHFWRFKSACWSLSLNSNCELSCVHHAYFSHTSWHLCGHQVLTSLGDPTFGGHQVTFARDYAVPNPRQFDLREDKFSSEFSQKRLLRSSPSGPPSGTARLPGRLFFLLHTTGPGITHALRHQLGAGMFTACSHFPCNIFHRDHKVWPATVQPSDGSHVQFAPVSQHK